MNEHTPTRQESMAGTIRSGSENRFVVANDLSGWQRRRGYSRVERRLQAKRRGLATGVAPSRPTANSERKMNRDTWWLLGLVLIILIGIERLI